ncbi:hypothetical protein BY458DRAFT_524709 [Sporodiniella umbellata]|nr:hypothetical protein BY458DRAFT_524709 [Sporodiniella umbellata]
MNLFSPYNTRNCVGHSLFDLGLVTFFIEQVVHLINKQKHSLVFRAVLFKKKIFVGSMPHINTVKMYTTKELLGNPEKL